ALRVPDVADFSACFLLVFGQLAVGGLAALAIPPFSVLERGFYKSSASVFLGCALLFVAGNAALVARAGGVTPARGLELALWGLSGGSSATSWRCSSCISPCSPPPLWS